MFATGISKPLYNAAKIDVSKVLMTCALFLVMYAMFMHPVFAQATGATGTSAATQARVVGVVTQFQTIMFAIGAFVLTAAFMFVGYAMAFGGKKWSDVANVCYGALVAGCGAMVVGWLFS